MSVRYGLYDNYRRMMTPYNKSLDILHKLSRYNPLADTFVGRLQKATVESAIRLLKHYPKQGFDYQPVVIEGIEYPVAEEVVVAKPFCSLLRFRREGLPQSAPKLLCVAALSGHHATLSRATFEEFLPDHEVYVTDWEDARNVPVSEGTFGYEGYVNYIEEFMELLGPGNHLLAICQAGPAAMTAVAYMAKHENPARPLTFTVMAAPIDTRVNISANKLQRFTDILNKKLLNGIAIHNVPRRYPGAGRKVYPGALQLGGFVSLNLTAHLEKHVDFFKDVLANNVEDAEKHRDFYDEYMAVLDMDADYYLETVEWVFLEQRLAKGTLYYRGERIDCSAIKDIALFALEGADDDMVSTGQTKAALTLCDQVPKKLKKYHLQEGVGHYGIFNGSKYREQVAPMIKDWIKRHHKSVSQRSLAISP